MTEATIAVRLPAGLRAWSGGQSLVRLQVEGTVTVGEVLEKLAAVHPDVERRVRDEQGRLRQHVNVFVGAENVRDLAGLATAVAAGAEVTILPAVSGGQGAAATLPRSGGTAYT